MAQSSSAAAKAGDRAGSATMMVGAEILLKTLEDEGVEVILALDSAKRIVCGHV